MLARTGRRSCAAKSAGSCRWPRPAARAGPWAAGRRPRRTGRTGACRGSGRRAAGSWPRARSETARCGEPTGGLGGERRRRPRAGRSSSGSRHERVAGCAAAPRGPSTQVGQRERVEPGRRVREIGVDLEAVEVADDEERRVVQRLAVAAAAAGRPPRGPCACPCTPRRSGPASRRRRSRRRRRPCRRPSRRRTSSPVGSASLGVGTPSMRHRSMKCSLRRGALGALAPGPLRGELRRCHGSVRRTSGWSP